MKHELLLLGVVLGGCVAESGRDTAEIEASVKRAQPGPGKSVVLELRSDVDEPLDHAIVQVDGLVLQADAEGRVELELYADARVDLPRQTTATGTVLEQRFDIDFEALGNTTFVRRYLPEARPIVVGPSGSGRPFLQGDQASGSVTLGAADTSGFLAEATWLGGTGAAWAGIPFRTTADIGGGAWLSLSDLGGARELYVAVRTATPPSSVELLQEDGAVALADQVWIESIEDGDDRDGDGRPDEYLALVRWSQPEVGDTYIALHGPADGADSVGLETSGPVGLADGRWLDVSSSSCRDQGPSSSRTNVNLPPDCQPPDLDQSQCNSVAGDCTLDAVAANCTGGSTTDSCTLEKAGGRECMATGSSYSVQVCYDINGTVSLRAEIIQVGVGVGKRTCKTMTVEGGYCAQFWAAVRTKKRTDSCVDEYWLFDHHYSEKVQCKQDKTTSTTCQ